MFDSDATQRIEELATITAAVIREGMEGVRQTANSIAAGCRLSPEFLKMLKSIHGPTAGEMFAQLSKGERGEHESQRHARRT